LLTTVANMTVLWVSLAGALGAMSRYVVDSQTRRRWPVAFPAGTMLVNVSGSLVLGVLTGLVIAHGATTELRTIAGSGFCGGYTTFSAASVDTVRLAEQRRWFACLAYAGGTLTLAVLAAALGLALVGA
jgi:fluoride exporter